MPLFDNPWPIIYDTGGVEDRAQFSEFGTLQTQQGQSKFADGKTINTSKQGSFIQCVRYRRHEVLQKGRSLNLELVKIYTDEEQEDKVRS